MKANHLIISHAWSKAPALLAWVTVAGSDSVTNVTITVNSVNGTLFFRLTYP